MNLHPWNASPREAVKIQKEFKSRLQIVSLKQKPKQIAGADVSFNRFSNIFYAGFVVLELSSLRVIETAYHVCEVHFPYIPGLLSFREIPPLMEAFKKLTSSPDVFMFDGHGIAHPRRLGIASHMGLLLEKPTMGCAKKVLTGSYQVPDPVAGHWSDLMAGDEKIGEVVRTKNKVKPVFVSPGHLMDFKSAREILLMTTGKYRIPEPTRLAHNYVNQCRINQAH